MKTPIRFLFTLLCAAIVGLPIVHATTYTVQSTGDGAANAANCPGAATLSHNPVATIGIQNLVTHWLTTICEYRVSLGLLAGLAILSLRRVTKQAYASIGFRARVFVSLKGGCSQSAIVR